MACLTGAIKPGRSFLDDQKAGKVVRKRIVRVLPAGLQFFLALDVNETGPSPMPDTSTRARVSHGRSGQSWTPRPPVLNKLSIKDSTM